MDNLYESPEQSEDMRPEHESPEGEEEHGEGQTALVNKELCPDCLPGDRLIVEVLKDHGAEMELRYIGKEGEEERTAPTAEPAMAERGGASDSLME